MTAEELLQNICVTGTVVIRIQGIPESSNQFQMNFLCGKVFSRLVDKRQHFRICLIGSSPDVPLHTTPHAFDRIGFTVKLGRINKLHTIFMR